MKVVNRENAKHYHWKNVCDGWHFVDSGDLSIIAERMPPHTAEDMHYHSKARQFFYILTGEAKMELETGELRLEAGTGVEIAPLEAHKMMNTSQSDVEFIVVSVPKSHGDKITL